VKKKRRITAVFEWTDQRSQAAIALAEGKTQKEVAQEVDVAERSLRDWLNIPEFAAEVDRLSLMIDVSSRAQRLRLAMRVVRAKTKDGEIKTDKDLLEWLKFAQSETDGIKLDITKIAAALGANDASVADSRSGGVGSADEAAEQVH